MLLHEGAEGPGVTPLRLCDELVVFQWPVLHCDPFYTERGSGFRR